MVGIHFAHQVVLLDRVGSIVDKVVVAFDAQFFGGLVQAEE